MKTSFRLSFAVAVLFLSAPAFTQEIRGYQPQRLSGSDNTALTRPLPSAHKFWDRTNWVLYGAAATAAAADFSTTRHAVAHGGRELNPLAQPFAGSDAGFAAYKVASLGSYLGLSYLFHRKGWHKLERFVPVIAIGADSTAASLNRKRSF